MSIIPQLASQLGRRDEIPNQELAQRIADAGDTSAVRELAENLNHKNKDIQSDCIKTLYEIGERRPELISPYVDAFVALLSHKNNRLQWGGMAALDCVACLNPQPVFAALDRILAAADKGSVITKDHAVNILVSLLSIPAYTESAFPLLVEQLQSCPPNQLPMYAERSFTAIPGKDHERFKQVLQSRLPDLDKESKRKRLEKIIKKCR